LKDIRVGVHDGVEAEQEVDAPIRDHFQHRPLLAW
jgi:hypothetical protein